MEHFDDNADDNAPKFAATTGDIPVYPSTGNDKFDSVMWLFQCNEKIATFIVKVCEMENGMSMIPRRNYAPALVKMCRLDSSLEAGGDQEYVLSFNVGEMLAIQAALSMILKSIVKSEAADEDGHGH